METTKEDNNETAESQLGKKQADLEFPEDTLLDFEFEMKNYRVSIFAWKVNRIKLPDGRVLRAGLWFEFGPPMPLKLEVITDNRRGIPIATYISEAV